MRKCRIAEEALTGVAERTLRTKIF